jgi:hypothetical protein
MHGKKKRVSSKAQRKNELPLAIEKKWGNNNHNYVTHIYDAKTPAEFVAIKNCCAPANTTTVTNTKASTHAERRAVSAGVVLHDGWKTKSVKSK